MSDELSHVLVGEWLGAAVDAIPNEKINKPLVAFLLGFVAHGIQDKVDNDYTINYQAWSKDIEQLKKEAPDLALQCSGIGKAIWDLCHIKDEQKRATELASILGEISPDVIEAIYMHFNPSAWQSGQLAMPFHRGGSDKPMQSLNDAIGRAATLNLIQWSWRI